MTTDHVQLVRDWVAFAGPFIEQDCMFGSHEGVEDGVRFIHVTACGAAYEGCSITVYENGRVATGGDSGAFNDYIGHARGGEDEPDVSLERLYFCLRDYAATYAISEDDPAVSRRLR